MEIYVLQKSSIYLQKINLKFPYDVGCFSPLKRWFLYKKGRSFQSCIKINDK